MISWIKSIFKKKLKTPEFNMHHPDVEQNVEFAFEVKGKKYYRFIKDYRVPVGRFKFIDAYLYEAELRMDINKLNNYMELLLKHLDGKSGQIDLNEAYKVIWAIQSRCKLAFSPETIERLASVVFFDETEDLSDFDEEYGKQKIKIWRKARSLAFFLTMPIIDLLNLRDFSEQRLQMYMNQIASAEEMINDLTSGQEKAL